MALPRASRISREKWDTTLAEFGKKFGATALSQPIASQRLCEGRVRNGFALSTYEHVFVAMARVPAAPLCCLAVQNGPSKPAAGVTRPILCRTARWEYWVV